MIIQDGKQFSFGDWVYVPMQIGVHLEGEITLKHAGGAVTVSAKEYRVVTQDVTLEDGRVMPMSAICGAGPHPPITICPD